MAAVLLLAAVPFAYGGSAPDRGNGRCYRVTIQNDQVNESSVQQDCEWNVNRTVQVGATNKSYTHQTGKVNNNKVRQYSYDPSKYFDRMRGR